MIEIIQADLSRPVHAAAFINLLDAYASDPMGGGNPLPEHVRENLAATLHARSDVTVILALADGAPVGLVNCIEGFSTFACKPLLNIHDLVVKAAYRGQGIAKLMLQKVEQIALEKGCCKITLEVLEGNAAARAAYASFGFAGYTLDPKMGKAQFLQKKL